MYLIGIPRDYCLDPWFHAQYVPLWDSENYLLHDSLLLAAGEPGEAEGFGAG